MEIISFELGGTPVTINYREEGSPIINEIGTISRTLVVEKLTMDGMEPEKVTEKMRRKIAATMHRKLGCGNHEGIRVVIPGTRNYTMAPRTKATRIELGKKLEPGNVTIEEILEDKLPSGYI